MPKPFLKNPIVLTGLLIVFNLILGTLIFVLVYIFNLRGSWAITVPSIIGPMVIAYQYPLYFKEKVPKSTKRTIAILYNLALFSLVVTYSIIFPPSNIPLLIAILFGLYIIFTFITYWILGSGNSIIDKADEEKDNKSNQE